MKRTLSLLAAGIAGALIALLALNFATGAFAQGSPGSGQMAHRGQMGSGQMGSGQMAHRGQMGGQAQSLVGLAAAQLGLSQADLVAQLGADRSIAAALTAGGVDPMAFIDSFVATRAERLAAAVAAGTMTRADADARLATARSMSTARIYQPFTALGPGGQGGGAGHGSVDANGDGVCDMMPAGGQGHMGGGRGGRGQR